MFIWHWTLALSTSCLASAMRPEVVKPMWSSILYIFSIESMMISLLEILLSTMRITPSLYFRPTVVVPLFTDSLAYSTWYSLPSGEKVETP